MKKIFTLLMMFVMTVTCVCAQNTANDDASAAFTIKSGDVYTIQWKKSPTKYLNVQKGRLVFSATPAKFVVKDSLGSWVMYTVVHDTKIYLGRSYSKGLYTTESPSEAMTFTITSVSGNMCSIKLNQKSLGNFNYMMSYDGRDFDFDSYENTDYYHWNLMLDKVATGINSVSTSEHKDNVVYDLQGRRVKHPGKGVYIVNGKKVRF